MFQCHAHRIGEVGAESPGAGDTDLVRLLNASGKSRACLPIHRRASSLSYFGQEEAENENVFCSSNATKIGNLNFDAFLDDLQVFGENATNAITMYLFLLSAHRASAVLLMKW